MWEPGALHLPLTKAPSGHLCLKLDHFDRLDDEAGVPNIVLYPREMTLFSGTGSREDQRSAKAEDADLRREWHPSWEPINPEPPQQQQQWARCTFDDDIDVAL